MLSSAFKSYCFNKESAGQDDESAGLFVIEAKNSENVLPWVLENKDFIEAKILHHGGILLRSFAIFSLSEFNKLAETLYPNLLDYVYRSTPRTKLGGKIYTATEYPANRTIPLHNENSYSRNWPSKILFFSIIAAEQGGETPIADSRRIYAKLDTEVRRKFEEKGVLYLRNYTPGVDLSWQEVFQTTEREEVEEFCVENEITFQWKAIKPELSISQICQASTVHPQTGEKVWFNQAHLFHSSVLDEDSRQVLIAELGEQNLPRNAFYGDGEPIEAEVLEHIRHVYKQETIKFKWRKSDILLLDNLLMAHGREPYRGERKLAVAMA